jgi:TPR repeat protein
MRRTALGLVAVVAALGLGCKKKQDRPAAGPPAVTTDARPAVAAALTALETGCAGDDPEACRNLGVIYAEGKGVVADPARAAGYYRQACDRGNAAGCNNLGLVTMTGAGGRGRRRRRARAVHQGL